MLKILIAEDSVLLADMLEEFLISQGYDVCGIAGTVDEGVHLAELHEPDIGIFDFRLGNGEFGADIRRRLKKSADMGILYASGDLLGNKLSTADGDAYIQKPYGMFDVVRALQIVQEVRTTGSTSFSRFPKNFHFLKSPLHKSYAA